MVTGGRRPEHLTVGHYYEPTLLDVRDNSNPAARTRSSGRWRASSATSTSRKPYAIANDSMFGLAGMVYGDTVAATRAYARQQIRAGTVSVNAAAPTATRRSAGTSRAASVARSGYHRLHKYQEIKHLYIG